MAELDQQNDSSKFLLYAVNILLKTIGERPIKDDVELAEVIEAQLAAEALIDTKKSVMAEGWDFNRDNNQKFAVGDFVFNERNLLVDENLSQLF